LTAEAVLTAFDEHLRRTRGVCAGTRLNYGRFAGAFLQTMFADGPVVVAQVHPRHVVEFVGGLSCRYRPRTVELAASSLRSFFRFLRAEGLRGDRLEDAVPMVPHRPAGLVRHLVPGQFEQLIASLDSSSPRGLRDRAIILCMARLGLRASEVVQLRLEDVDWRNATVRVRTRKTGHGALLPLPDEVGTALADYLQHGRPDSPAREVFVLHWLRVGAAISSSIVGRAVDNALRRAGIDAPIRGGNLLRHSLATELLDDGASLREIADLFGFGLLACTGLRICEALALACGDVDLADGMLTVRAGKRGRTRLVPLHPSAVAPMRDYATDRARRYGPPGDGAAFFRTDRSDRISYKAANHTFIVLRRQLGWTTAGRTRAPRVHDLRHRMVVRRIQAWHANDVNVDAKIAVLATYLGHVEVRDVYWYMSAVPELMTIVADRFEAFAEHGAAGVS
jgi:site-specific recombinase XerD